VSLSHDEVRDWSGYADAVHARWTGNDYGWDHLLDNHLGFTVGGQV
jgi:hypothetical protein